MIRKFARRILRRPRRPLPFNTSSDYWERRYRKGGNSGAGSYNRLARFKADFLNEFVRQREVASVIEFGCGDGAQLLLSDYPPYVGVDVSPTVIATCSERFFGRDDMVFYLTDDLPTGTTADLALSLDVIYHLVEDEIFAAYMRQLFDSAERFVIVYASDVDKAWPSPHVRHRKFTDWIERHRPSWRLVRHVPNEYPYDPADPENTSFADFYIFELH